MNRRTNPVASLLVLVLRGYQRVVSPLLPKSCKYHPSCSQYAIEALREFGVFRGVILAGWRLLRCNPMSYGGHDPVENQTLFAARGAKRVRGTRGRSVAEGPSVKAFGAQGEV